MFGDFEEFIKRLDERGYGILNFNTYQQKGENYFYICVSGRGRASIAIKGEGKIHQLDARLCEILNDIDAIKHRKEMGVPVEL